MKPLTGAAIACVFVLAAGGAQAAMQTVTLAIDGMYCAACPYIVKQTLAAVPGVSNVDVSLETQSATVVYDDALSDVADMTGATAAVGYPSRPAQ